MFLSCAWFAKIVKDAYRIKRWKIEVGDKVFINRGEGRGSTGNVILVDHERNALKVKGQKLFNLKTPEGEETRLERFTHYSNVNLVDPILNKPTRIRVELANDGSMIRISKKSGAVIPLPDRIDDTPDPATIVEGEKDTSPEVALLKTYHAEQEVATMKNVRQRMRKYNHDLH
jgi:large subunit ribosomal protein L24